MLPLMGGYNPTFKSFIGFTKVKQRRSGKPFSDTVKDLMQIMDDWDNCEGGRE